MGTLVDGYQLQELIKAISLIRLTNYGIGTLLCFDITQPLNHRILHFSSLLLHISLLRYSVEYSVRGESSFIRCTTAYVNDMCGLITSGGTVLCLLPCSYHSIPHYSAKWSFPKITYIYLRYYGLVYLV
jgi:hypothetical protein